MTIPTRNGNLADPPQKIQWYKLSDLPTFKKNKNPTLNQNADIVNANKFYMVAPFLVPLKKWINQQRRQDAEQALHYDVHDEEETAATEAVIDEYSPIAAPIEVSQLGVVDPASELKRLLSVGGASIAMPPVQPPQEPQANTLLAMLRGNGANHLQPPQMAGTLPTTPMEQMTGYPAQPPSPHYHHPHESPDIRRQPPPHFPFNTSPQWNENGPDPRFAVGPYVSGNGNRMNMSMPPAQGVFGSQNPGFMPSGHPDGQMQDVQQSNMRPSAFTPQDQQGGLQHGPIAPKASQLPPPKLSGHTMNLLNAFKEESRSSNAGLQAPQGAAASLQSPFVFPAQPRNAHQSSLLDLFRSPSAQHAEPVPTGPSTSSEQQEQPVTAQPSAKIAPQATIQRPVTLGAAQRKSSAVSMITRTLPRVRLDDTHQFPSLGSGSATTLPPSKEAPMPGPWGAVSQKASQQKQPAAHIASGEPMKVMSRPASSAGKIPPKASASVASSPSQRSPSKQDTLGKALAAPIVTILQRPASAKSAVSNGSQRPSASPARAQTEKASKPFQPQLLRREKPEKAASPRTESTPTNDAPKDNTNQRNALLALFAKNAQGSSQPLITSQPSTTKQAEQPTAAQLIPAPVATNEDTPSTAQKAAPRGAAAWNNFAVQAQAAEAQPKAPEQVSVSQQRWKETFKQTPIEENWMGGPRKVVNVEKTIHGEEVPKEAVAKTSPVPTGTPFDEMSRSRMGSRASIASAGALREGMKSPTTPLEAKDFLLDFLNGVAKGGR